MWRPHAVQRRIFSAPRVATLSVLLSHNKQLYFKLSILHADTFIENFSYSVLSYYYISHLSVVVKNIIVISMDEFPRSITMMRHNAPPLVTLPLNPSGRSAFCRQNVRLLKHFYQPIEQNTYIVKPNVGRSIHSEGMFGQCRRLRRGAIFCSLYQMGCTFKILVLVKRVAIGTPHARRYSIRVR
jgi:hypothetical protein